jgi:hypothetical protein
LLQDNYPEFVAKQVDSHDYLLSWLDFDWMVCLLCTECCGFWFCLGVHQCPLVVSCILYNDQSIYDTKNQKQICIRRPIKICWDTFQVSEVSKSFNFCQNRVLWWSSWEFSSPIYCLI